MSSLALQGSMSPSTTRPVIDSSSPFDWRSFPNYHLSAPLTPATSTDPGQSPPIHHSSSLPHNSAPIAMSFPVQSNYPYSFHDPQLPVQSHVPPPVNPSYSYPSPEIDLQHMLEMPMPNNVVHDPQDSTHHPLLSHSERDHDPILSPVSVNSYMTPCQSPVDMRSPLDYPTPTSINAPLKGPLVHTILPSSSFPENHVINFDVSVSTIFPLSPPLSPHPSSSLPRLLNSIAVHVMNRRTHSQNVPRRLSLRKRTLMRPRSSNHRSD